MKTLSKREHLYTQQSNANVNATSVFQRCEIFLSTNPKVCRKILEETE